MAKYKRKDPEVVEAITWEEFIEHGKREVGEGGLIAGIPWHFEYDSTVFSHDEDDLYVFMAHGNMMEMSPDKVLIKRKGVDVVSMALEEFREKYEVL